jgi:hypothetical protein
VRGPADYREHVPVGDAHLERVRIHPPAAGERHDGPQAEKRGAPDAGHGVRGGEQELAVAGEHDGAARPRESLHQRDRRAVRGEPLREPAARDDQRVVAPRRVRRGFREVGGDREPRVAGELGVVVEAEEVVHGGGAGVNRTLPRRYAVHGHAERGEGVERDGRLVVLHVVTAQHQDLPRRRHGARMVRSASFGKLKTEGVVGACKNPTPN